MYPSWKNNYLRYRTYLLSVVAKYKERSDIRTYLEILLSLIAISIFSIFALRPTLLTIAGLIREIKSKELTLSQMETKINNLSQAQLTFDKERQAIYLLNISIPKKIDPTVFARQVEGLSSKHGLAIFQIQTGQASISEEKTTSSNNLNSQTPNLEKEESQLPQGAKPFNYSIEITASTEQFTSLVNFLLDLENLRLPSKIDSAVIEINNINQEKILLMKISGKIPYYPTEER